MMVYISCVEGCMLISRSSWRPGRTGQRGRCTKQMFLSNWHGSTSLLGWVLRHRSPMGLNVPRSFSVHVDCSGIGTCAHGRQRCQSNTCVFALQGAQDILCQAAERFVGQVPVPSFASDCGRQAIPPQTPATLPASCPTGCFSCLVQRSS